MNAWLVTYSGLWLGGKAVVVARNKEEAVKLVEADSASIEFKEVEVEELGPVNRPVVLYNDNGNY